MALSSGFRRVYRDIISSHPLLYLYHKQIVVLLLVVIVGAGSFFGYRLYRGYQDTAAQKLLAECITEYQKVLSHPSADRWSEAELVFRSGYLRSSASRLAPYFLALHVDALMGQNKETEALALLDQLLRDIIPGDPLTSFYKLKRVLIGIDSAEGALKESSKKELETLAHDSKVSCRDVALYYLGLMAGHEQDYVTTKSLWQELVDAYPETDQRKASPWAMMAKAKLLHL